MIRTACATISIHFDSLKEVLCTCSCKCKDLFTYFTVILKEFGYFSFDFTPMRCPVNITTVIIKVQMFARRIKTK